MARKVYVGGPNPNKKNLPSGYTEVEYIASTGTQYVDTGFSPNQDSRIAVDMDVTAASAQCALFGARASSSNGFLLFTFNDNAGYQSDYGSNQSTGKGGTSSGRHTLDKNKNRFYVDGTLVVTQTTQTFSVGYSAYLLSINAAGSAMTDYPVSAKLYSAQIYDNDVLVRDYVPCKNSSGAVGLYDMVNGVFYGNAGSGAFTAGASLLDSVARNVRKIFIGVDGVARKVMKGYIGVGGVARPFWTGGILSYYGTATELSKARSGLAAAPVGNYGLFAGGSGKSDVVDAYDKSLVRSVAEPLSQGRWLLAGGYNDNYAVFAGGRLGGTGSSDERKEVDAYDASLTRFTPSVLLSTGVHDGTGTSNGEYALIAGGENRSADAVSRLYALDKSLTATLTTLYSAYCLASTRLGEYGVFAGGNTTTSALKTVKSVDTSLTVETRTSLTTGRRYPSGVTAGNHVLIGGGYNTSGTRNATVETFDESFTKSEATSLSRADYGWRTISLGEYGIFASTSYNTSAAVNSYDASLTMKVENSLNQAKGEPAAVAVGDYALIGGGDVFVPLENGSVSGSYKANATVDVFTI